MYCITSVVTQHGVLTFPCAVEVRWMTLHSVASWSSCCAASMLAKASSTAHVHDMQCNAKCSLRSTVRLGDFDIPCCILFVKLLLYVAYQQCC
jgi:hypothetical protein